MPETTEKYHRIPVSEDHEGHRIRTITISAERGIKALYCGQCKEVVTYLFDVEKWSMAEAKAWIKEHEASQMGELIPLADFAEAGQVISIQVARPGVFMEKHGREVEITEDDLDDYVANFEAGTAGQELPIFQGHPSAATRPEEPAAAWYKRLYTKIVDGVKTLWADIELSELGLELVVKKLYKYFSPSIDLEGKTIKGGGFVNLPAIKGMAAMELSEFLQEASMDDLNFVEKVRRALGQLLGQEADLATKTDDGQEYPERCYLYVPDPDKPSTWKLRICEMVGGDVEVTVRQLGRAAAALGPGFRGRKAQLPAEAKAAAKRKLVAQYKKLGIEEEDIPDYLLSEEVTQMTDEERKALEAQIRKQIEAEFAQKQQELAEMTESVRKDVEAKVRAEFAEKAKLEAELSQFAQEVTGGEAGLSTKPEDIVTFLAGLDEEQREKAKGLLKAKIVDFSERGHAGAGTRAKQMPDEMKLALKGYLAGKSKVKEAVEKFCTANDLVAAEYDLSEFLPTE